jgi:hypothetical protein|tara:strand:- start:99 stop:578 length:480 start_codon:yes stop_codon:yes gene_type:complete
MNIYKNFLNEKDFKQIESFMMSPNMPWFFNDGVVSWNDKKYFQFTFLFLDEGKKNCVDKHFNILKPFFKKIKFNKLNRIKANLLTKDKKIIEHGMHTDQKQGITGIFYLNTCNGYTKFETGEKIKSEKNKYIEFNSTLKHTGSTCTDEKRRVVINFNYV